jgi:hypothetical protein
MGKQFTTAAAFKNALEARLRKRAEERSVPFSTLQLKFVIERLLARLFHISPPPWLLKGGFAMDLRFRPRARTTKDVDLTIPIIGEWEGPMSAALRDKLQETLDTDLGDFLTFRVGEPKRELTNAPKGGARYPLEAVLLGKVYARFHIDVGIGDPNVAEPEQLTGDDLLDFASIAPVVVLAIPRAQQFAEKIHAYTFPWVGRTNTRTKDLVDLVLLIERGLPDVEAIRVALQASFATRGSHPVPSELAAPPESWAVDFPAMAEEANISTRDYLEAFGIISRFWSEAALGEAG